MPGPCAQLPGELGVAPGVYTPELLPPMTRILPLYISVVMAGSIDPFWKPDGADGSLIHVLPDGLKRYWPPEPIETTEPSGSVTQPSSPAGAGRDPTPVQELLDGLKICVFAVEMSLATMLPFASVALPVSYRLP